MRYFIEVETSQAHAVHTAQIQATSQMEERIGVVRIENLVLGMQHQLGHVAAGTMTPGDCRQQIFDDLKGLVALATIYMMALNPLGDDDESSD